MHSIAWQMRYGLPNSLYMGVVYSLRRHRTDAVGKQWDDPFAVHISPQIQQSSYVIRRDVEAELSRPGHTIILGAPGSGKTTLRHCFGPQRGERGDRPLAVRLAVRRPDAQVGAPNHVRFVSSATLATEIFDTFWGDFIQSTIRRSGAYTPYLRKNESWRAKLRWFCQHLPPRDLYVPGEHELMAWLHSTTDAPPLANRLSDDLLLAELIRFITSPYQVGMNRDDTDVAYSRVDVLIDFEPVVSIEPLRDLIADIEGLCRLNLGNLQFKIFLDRAWKETAEMLGCVQEGRIALFTLPHWPQAELEILLKHRLPDFDVILPSGLLQDGARSSFLPVVARAALVAYEADRKEPIDAPIHALRIARGLLAACGGCWQEQGFNPPLSANQIEKLAHLYWDS